MRAPTDPEATIVAKEIWTVDFLLTFLHIKMSKD